MFLKAIIIFCVIITYKALSNFIKYKRCKKLSDMHVLWLSGNCDNFIEYRGEILQLFKSANIQDSLFPTSSLIGYGQIASGTASVFANFPSMNKSVVGYVITCFDEAIGTYRRRCFESFNPLYWIETILFFPRHLLTYLGVDSEKFLFKSLNILLTFIWWILGVVFMFFRPYLYTFIASLFG